MIKPELYHKTIGILVKAYLNDTLIPGNCAACAVGNLIAASMKITYTNPAVRSCIDWKEHAIRWDQVFCTRNGYQFINENKYEGEAKEQIDSTGYTWHELAKIEAAFESTPRGVEDIMYFGLMAVINVLGEIHQASESEVKASKELFVKH